MTQTEERAAPTYERAEQMLARAGAQLGQWAGHTLLRARHTTQALRQKAAHLDLSASERHAKHANTARETQPSLERAEMVVDRFAERISHWAVGGNLSARRTMARLQEDVEDMWVEAQEIQKEWQEKYRHPEDDAR